MTLPPLAYRLDREIYIRAPREGVFRYFTDSRRFAVWWGAGSSIDPRPGGAVRVRYPNGIEAGGTVLEIEPPARIVFSYGYASGQPMPLGASRVTVELAEAIGGGTRVSLRHDLADATVRDQHVQGWRYQMAVFANVTTDEVAEGLDARIDAWLAAWAEPDATERRAALALITAPEITFRDRYGCTSGLDELDAHVAAVQQFFPGTRLTRLGIVRQCQGTALGDWTMHGPDGAERARGTNVYELAADGRLLAVVGLAAPTAPA